MCETQCDMLSMAHLCIWQDHLCCHLNCSTLASQTGRLLEDETVTVWYTAFINDELIWDELAWGFTPSGSQTFRRISWAGETKDFFVSVHSQIGLYSIYPHRHCYWQGWQPPLRVAWIDGCAFTKHVNNCQQLLHFVANRERRRLSGKVSHRDLNCSFLCSLSFSPTKRSRPFIISHAFISSTEKCSWGVILIEVGNWILLHTFCCGFFSWQFPTDKCILSLLMSLKKVVLMRWQFSLFFLHLFFVCLLFIVLSRGTKLVVTFLSRYCNVLLQLYLNQSLFFDSFYTFTFILLFLK